MKKRVVIPVNNSKALVALARKVNEKHLADGDSSLLKSLNWSQVTAIITQADRRKPKPRRVSVKCWKHISSAS